MLRTYKTITLSFPPDLLKKLERLAKRENETKSEFVRESIKHRIEELELKYLQRQLAQQGAKMGINTEADVDRVIHEYHKEESKRVR
jgi:predicted DNA-binding protein